MVMIWNHGRQHQLRQIIAAMRAGDWFVWSPSRSYLFKAAAQTGARITTTRLPSGACVVWRLA